MCPVCRANFRGTRECSRCGADLTALMDLLAGAWKLRQAARRAILEGDARRASAFAARAEAICHSPAGERLKFLSAWLAGTG